jgi:hypothetical protein
MVVSRSEGDEKSFFFAAIDTIERLISRVNENSAPLA